MDEGGERGKFVFPAFPLSVGQCSLERRAERSWIARTKREGGEQSGHCSRGKRRGCINTRIRKWRPHGSKLKRRNRSDSIRFRAAALCAARCTLITRRLFAAEFLGEGERTTRNMRVTARARTRERSTILSYCCVLVAIIKAEEQERKRARNGHGMCAMCYSRAQYRIAPRDGKLFRAFDAAFHAHVSVKEEHFDRGIEFD